MPTQRETLLEKIEALKSKQKRLEEKIKNVFEVKSNVDAKLAQLQKDLDALKEQEEKDKNKETE